MDANILCFGLFGILLTGYLLLEGFDYGIGMLQTICAKTELERQVFLNTLAPMREGYEVWLVTAGAVLFAGFPIIYAALFSGLYLALFLLLAALILRSLAVEFRQHEKSQSWRTLCNWGVFFGSMLPAFLWGLILAGFLKGYPINADFEYSGSVFEAFSIYTVVAGTLFTLLFMLHGAGYLLLRVDTSLGERIKQYALRLYPFGIGCHIIFILLTVMQTQAGQNMPAAGILALTVFILGGGRYFLQQDRYWLGFLATTLTLLGSVSAIFISLFPVVVVSSLHPEYSLDIYRAASGPVTLQIISRAMLVVIPLLVAGQIWKAALFWRRLSVAGLELQNENHQFKQRIKLAQALEDCLDKTSKALRSRDSQIINKLSAKTRQVLWGKQDQSQQTDEQALADKRRNKEEN